jgi:hypothetical protein
LDNGTVAWITGAAAVGGGLVGGLVSGFYQHVRDRMQRPILKLDYQGRDGLNKVEVSYKQGESSVDDIYIRVRLRNEGRSIARKSVVYLTAIEEVYTSAQTPTSFAEAMPLAWPLYKFSPRDIPTSWRPPTMPSRRNSHSISLIPKIGMDCARITWRRKKSP